MHKRIPIKNPSREIHLLMKRCIIAFLVLCLLVGLLIWRLAYLQIYKHNMYVTLSTKNYLDLVPVEPTRGLIYDRNGVLLAENIPVFSLDVIPYQVTDFKKTLQQLKKIVTLTENDINQFQKQLKQHRRFDEIPLKLRLSEDEVARFAENQFHFKGVLVKARLMRHYPFAESLSHVLGHVGRINLAELQEIDPINYSASFYIGKLGLEKYYEEELHGSVGYEEVENDASGKPIRTLKEIKGIPGKNLYLTLDSSLQFAAEKALTNFRGAVVVIQPASGQVLAMVSNPGFDPNLFVLGISHNDYNLLQNAPDRPLYDRALRGLYPLASTIKPYLALGGLEEGLINAEDETYCPGWFKLPHYSRIYHDWQHHGHGTVDVNKAIARSCDVYFYDLGLKMGIHRMDAILSQFGFGALTGIDLEGELTGILASPEWKQQARGMHWYQGDTVISSIGQGSMQATPLQLAAAVATLANRGKRFMPYLLMGEQQPGQAYVQQAPIPLDPVFVKDHQNWEIVIKAMQEVIASPQGSAYRFGRPLSYTIAAKTGTAQLISKRGNPNEIDKQDDLPEKLREHHLFVAFAPVDKPQIAVAVVTENSSHAIDVARIIFDYYLGEKSSVNRFSSTKTKKTIG